MGAKRFASMVILGASLLGCEGCGNARYALRGMPFCTTEDGSKVPQFAEDYVLVMKTSSGHEIGALSATMRHRGVMWRDEVLLAIVSCTGHHSLGGASLKEALAEFDDDHVPAVCPGMKVVVHERIYAKQDAAAKARGFSGYFDVPDATALKCTTGTLSQASNHTLEQILHDFSLTADAFAQRHDGRLPTTMAELEADGGSPLPADAWGTPLDFVRDGQKIVLRSAGPDRQLGTADDIQVMEKTENGYRSSTTFEGSDYGRFGDYKAYVAKQAK